jgi:hypothetical protein
MFCALWALSLVSSSFSCVCPCNMVEVYLISERLSAPIFKFTTSTCYSSLAYSSALKMKVAWSSEMSVDFQWTSQCYGPEEGTLTNPCCENLKSYNITMFWTVGGMRNSDSPFWHAHSLLDANLVLPVHTPCNAVKCPNYILKLAMALLSSVRFPVTCGHVLWWPQLLLVILVQYLTSVERETERTWGCFCEYGTCGFITVESCRSPPCLSLWFVCM